MKFFKQNSYDIIRLLINQIGITIFSLVLYTALGMVNLDDGTKLGLNVTLSVFSMLFYFSLLYTVAWDWGAKDKIRIDAGRMSPDKFKGAKMAIFANLPNFILTCICFTTFAIYLIFDSATVAYSISSVFNIFVRLLMSMYLGLLMGIFKPLSENLDMYYFAQAIGYFIVPWLAISATQLGYYFGTKEKKIFGSTHAKK